jgi:hypothetical protein
MGMKVSGNERAQTWRWSSRLLYSFQLLVFLESGRLRIAEYLAGPVSIGLHLKDLTQ